MTLEKEIVQAIRSGIWLRCGNGSIVAEKIKSGGERNGYIFVENYGKDATDDEIAQKAIKVIREAVAS